MGYRIFFQKDKKRFDALSENTVYCPYCNHSITMINKDRKLCTQCGHYVYKNQKSEFKYKLKEMMSK